MPVGPPAARNSSIQAGINRQNQFSRLLMEITITTICSSSDSSQLDQGPPQLMAMSESQLRKTLVKLEIWGVLYSERPSERNCLRKKHVISLHVRRRLWHNWPLTSKLKLNDSYLRPGPDFSATSVTRNESCVIDIFAYKIWMPCLV